MRSLTPSSHESAGSTPCPGTTNEQIRAGGRRSARQCRGVMPSIRAPLRADWQRSIALARASPSAISSGDRASCWRSQPRRPVGRHRGEGDGSPTSPPLVREQCHRHSARFSSAHQARRHERGRGRALSYAYVRSAKQRPRVRHGSGHRFCGASDLSGAGWCGVRVRGWRDRDSKNRWFLRRRVLGVPVGVQPYAHVRAAGRLAGCQGHCGRRPPRWADRGPRRSPPRPGVVCRVRRSGGREGTPGGGAGGSAVLRAAGTAGVAQAPAVLS